MARSRRGNRDQAERPRPYLTEATAAAGLKLGAQLDRGRKLAEAELGSDRDLAGARSEFHTWEEFVSELLRRLFTTDELSEEFTAPVRYVFGGRGTLAEEVEAFRDDALARLRRLESIVTRLPLYEPVGTSRSGEPAVPTRSHGADAAKGRRVFVVHGREHGPRDAVRNFLRDLALEPVVLEDQPNKGRTIIEKFEANTIAVDFAVVVLTPDDVGGSSDDAQTAPRARQNVVLELGFFIGLLGRSRVAPLVFGDMEIPSDVDGIVYIKFDPDGAWKLRLAKELKAAGVDVDMNLAL